MRKSSAGDTPVVVCGGVDRRVAQQEVGKLVSVGLSAYNSVSSSSSALEQISRLLHWWQDDDMVELS